MRTKQVLLSLTLGLVVVFFLLTSGWVVAVAAGLLTTLGTRWGLATYHRTRYWLGRGSKGFHTERCPNCNRDRHRLGGDWMLRCRKCGWAPGYPLVRWLLYSVPAVQFRRSVSSSGAFAAGAAAAALATGSTSTSAAAPTVLAPGLPGASDVVLVVSAVLVVAGAVAWLLRPRRRYCASCGQDLGRRDVPNTCPRCGSNRFTTDDPGAGLNININ